MTEAEILQRLKPGSWVSKPERKALEAMLAQTRAASPSGVPDYSQYQAAQVAPEAANGEPSIQGSASFESATRRAMDLLRQTPSWRWVAYLRGIRESPKNDDSIAGFVSGGVFTVMRRTWRANAKLYAGTIVHEGVHASRGHATGIEEERIAYGHHVQALRELGASWWSISYYQGLANNPPHNNTYTEVA